MLLIYYPFAQLYAIFAFVAKIIVALGLLDLRPWARKWSSYLFLLTTLCGIFFFCYGLYSLSFYKDSKDMIIGSLIEAIVYLFVGIPTFILADVYCFATYFLTRPPVLAAFGEIPRWTVYEYEEEQKRLPIIVPARDTFSTTVAASTLLVYALVDIALLIRILSKYSLTDLDDLLFSVSLLIVPVLGIIGTPLLAAALLRQRRKSWLWSIWSAH